MTFRSISPGSKLSSVPSFAGLYEDFSHIELISSSKFNVFQVRLPGRLTDYALKVFPYKDGKISRHFLNEIMIADIKHPHIIAIHQKRKALRHSSSINSIKNSTVLFEFAPYGDFSDLINSGKLSNEDETLLRTYFHHLVEGVECLHAHGVCHLDLKPENLLLGVDYKLKIADFDVCVKKDNKEIFSKGTKNYRAPEIRNRNCRDPEAADIFSMGIILFIMKFRHLPYSEDLLIDGKNFYNLMLEEPYEFWNYHLKFSHKGCEFLNDDFCELFLGMTKPKPSDRLTIEMIKNTKWYQGEIYDENQLKKVMSIYLS